MKPVQLSTGIGEWLEIEMRRQNLDSDFFDCVILTASQQSVDRELDVVGRIRDPVVSEFEIKQGGSIALAQDFIGLSSQKRSYASAQP
jgi:hypothetical protein